MSKVQQQPSYIVIDDALLHILKTYSDVSNKDIMSFFFDTYGKLLKCKPNVRKFKAIPYNSLFHRVIRGYFPDTQIPFKMHICLNDNQTPWATVELAKSKTSPPYDIQKMQELIVEATLLETDIKLDIRKVKTMTPRGMDKLEAGK